MVIIAVVIKGKLNEIVESEIGECGVKIHDRLWIRFLYLIQIMDNSMNQNLQLYLVFINFKEVYYLVKRGRAEATTLFNIVLALAVIKSKGTI